MNKTVLFLPSQSVYLLFPFLIALTRTSSTMLKRTDKSGHPCVVLDLSGNALCISPLSMMLARDFW